MIYNDIEADRSDMAAFWLGVFSAAAALVVTTAWLIFTNL